MTRFGSIRGDGPRHRSCHLAGLYRRPRYVFGGVRSGSRVDPSADLENRQRRKPFVGSNPTQSVFFTRRNASGTPCRRSRSPADVGGCDQQASSDPPWYPAALVGRRREWVRGASYEIGRGCPGAAWIRISVAGQDSLGLQSGQPRRLDHQIAHSFASEYPPAGKAKPRGPASPDEFLLRR